MLDISASPKIFDNTLRMGMSRLLKMIMMIILIPIPIVVLDARSDGQ